LDRHELQPRELVADGRDQHLGNRFGIVEEQQHALTDVVGVLPVPRPDGHLAAEGIDLDLAGTNLALAFPVPLTRADVEVYRHVEILRRLPQWIPVGMADGRLPERLGHVAEHHALVPELYRSMNLLDGRVDVPERQQRQRDEPALARPAPLDEEVVVDLAALEP